MVVNRPPKTVTDASDPGVFLDDREVMRRSKFLNRGDARAVGTKLPFERLTGEVVVCPLAIGELLVCVRPTRTCEAQLGGGFDLLVV